MYIFMSLPVLGNQLCQMVASISEMVYVNFQVLIFYTDFPVTVSIFEDKEAGDFGLETFL